MTIIRSRKVIDNAGGLAALASEGILDRGELGDAERLPGDRLRDRVDVDHYPGLDLAVFGVEGVGTLRSALDPVVHVGDTGRLQDPGAL
jgi:hypothetical protein